MYGLMLAIGVLVAVRVAEVRWVRRGHPAKELSDIVVWIVIAGVDRRARVPRDHRLPALHRRLAPGVQDLGRRPRDLGRGHRRRDRRDRPRPPPPPRPRRPARLHRARARVRAGDRSLGQLVQPGAVRRADEAAVGDSRSIRRSDRTGTRSTRRSNRRSSTSRCTASRSGSRSIWIDHHFRLKKFQLFALYCMGYTAGRFVFEEMRIDPAHTIGPLRLNAWVSIVVFLAALAWFLWLGRHGTAGRTARSERRRTPRTFLLRVRQPESA